MSKLIKEGIAVIFTVIFMIFVVFTVVLQIPIKALTSEQNLGWIALSVLLMVAMWLMIRLFLLLTPKR